MQTFHANTEHYGSNLLGWTLTFICGSLGGLSTYLKMANHTLFIDAGTPEIVDFAIRSLIGGAIGLIIKVAGDLIVHRIKSKREGKK